MYCSIPPFRSNPYKAEQIRKTPKLQRSTRNAVDTNQLMKNYVLVAYSFDCRRFLHSPENQFFCMFTCTNRGHECYCTRCSSADSLADCDHTRQSVKKLIVNRAVVNKIADISSRCQLASSFIPFLPPAHNPVGEKST